MNNFQSVDIELINFWLSFRENMEYVWLSEEIESWEFTFLFGVKLDIIMEDGAFTLDGEIFIWMARFFHDNLIFEFLIISN